MDSIKKILILGASGLVGKAVAKECSNDFDVYGTYNSSPTNLKVDKQFRLTMQDENTIHEILNTVQPDIILSSLQGDYDVQYKFHCQLADAIKNKASTLYFISTTNVFDGELSRHHSELDEPISKSEYGQYKIKCEKMLIESLGSRANIIRIPGIWGKDSPRFNNIKSDIETAMPIQAYSNLECSFLLDTQLARQICYILKNELNGIFHLGAVDMVKESEFIEELVGRLCSEKMNIQCNPYEDKDTTYYFGLQSIRKDLPESIQMTNEEIITSLLS